jgi:hypothetical protein
MVTVSGEILWVFIETFLASTGINSKCAEGESDDKTCDTQAANKCWTLNGTNSKVGCGYVYKLVDYLL